MNKYLVLISIFLLFPLSKAYGFCGFYVAKGDAKLFNKASQVVLVRNEDKTVISMMNDYQGPLKQFALVVPVPVVLKEGQVNVGEKKLFERIDSFTAPRLVEYFDEDPCARRYMESSRAMMDSAMTMSKGGISRKKSKSLGVTIEEKFTVGEYDILILSAKESHGLEKWLKLNKYNIPKGAHKALAPYIKQKMKFFVAKVNIDKQSKTGLTYLRPLQFAFESEKFMLPIRLGMLNSNGPQDLFVYVLTKNGRVETTNYMTVKLPTNMNVPPYIKNEFPQFYKDLFATQVKKENMKAVFLEYFWDMNWCDPCAAEPLTPKELKGLGVFWLNDPVEQPSGPPNFRRRRPPRMGGAQPVKVTRLHLRYTKATFPEDLMFHETQDKRNFQGRYILQHPWKGSSRKCEAARRYLEDLPRRQEKEAQNLARLTGWDINKIRKKIRIKKPSDAPDPSDPPKEKEPKDNWWQNLWKK